MRVFFAVEIPEKIKIEIAKLQSTLKSLGTGVRWVKPEGIHCTLKFLGEVDAHILDGLSEAVLSAVGISPFTLEVSNPGVFPSWSNPRVIWLGISPVGGGIEILQKGIEKAMIPFGFEEENRPYRPHMTIGRVKFKNNLNRIMNYIRDMKDTLALGEFKVDSFNLYQSILKPQGAEYKIIKKFVLKG